MIKGWKFLKFWKHGYPEVERYLSKCDSYLPYDCYAALRLTPFDKVKCVILGQDPYHTKGMAHGLAFSVLPHVKTLPPSLRNIFKEYQSDLDYPPPRNGDLRLWAERGRLLLNSVLTVEEAKPGSHKGIGWERLTFEILTVLNEDDRPKVFMFWGKDAQQFNARISNPKHLLLTAPHPSPLAKGFLGCKHFSKASEFLNEPKDVWRLP